MPSVVMKAVARGPVRAYEELCPKERGSQLSTYVWPRRAESQNANLLPASQVRAIPLLPLSFSSYHPRGEEEVSEEAGGLTGTREEEEGFLLHKD